MPRQQVFDHRWFGGHRTRHHAARRQAGDGERQQPDSQLDPSPFTLRTPASGAVLGRVSLRLGLMDDAVSMLWRRVQGVEPQRRVSSIDDVVPGAPRHDHRPVVSQLVSLVDLVLTRTQRDRRVAVFHPDELVSMIMHLETDFLSGLQAHDGELEVRASEQHGTKGGVANGDRLDVAGPTSHGRSPFRSSRNWIQSLTRPRSNPARPSVLTVISRSPSSYSASPTLSGPSLAPVDRSISPGSRPSCLHQSSNTRFLCAKVSASPKPCQIVACSATSRRVFCSPPPPIRRGIGLIGGGLSLPSRAWIRGSASPSAAIRLPAVPNS